MQNNATKLFRVKRKYKVNNCRRLICYGYMPDLTPLKWLVRKEMPHFSFLRNDIQMEILALREQLTNVVWKKQT